MKYLNMLFAAVISGFLATSDWIIAKLDALPGFPNFLSVDYALAGFEKTRQRLMAAQRVANDRSDRYAALAERYDDLSDSADLEADRAARALQRLSNLLD